MDRLTHYDKDGRTFSSRGYEIALSRLAAYEDTGMDPGQVKDWANLGFGPALAKCCHDELDKLCNLVGGLDRLREICAAEKDGRLVVLPCKEKSGD